MTTPLVAGETSVSEDDEAESQSAKSSDFDLAESRGLCSVPCCCHMCYIILFLAYLVVFPLWGKWLVTAPMPKNFWHSELPAFPLLPIKDFGVAEQPSKDGRPQIIMTEIPSETSACNYTCGLELNDYRSNLMNFHVELTLDRSDLGSVNAHTTYPVLMASEDFENWQLVGDRRDAYPEPFFRSRSEDAGATYLSTTEGCSGPPKPNATFTSQGTYFLGCVVWTPEGREAVQAAKTLTQEDVLKYCSGVGGVCGWPCGSNIPSDRLPGCSALGVVNTTMITGVPMTDSDIVSLEGCDSPTGDCATSTMPMSKWKCHRCHVETDSVTGGAGGDDDAGGAGGGEGGEDGDDAGGDSGFDDWGIRRLRAGGRRLQDDEDEDTMVLRYKSLPRMQVLLKNAQLPQDAQIMNTPRGFVLASHSIEGPWTRIFVRDQKGDKAPPLPQGVEVKKDQEDTTIVYEEDTLYAMKLQRKNSLSIRSESCFGKRGPMYLVACAVNASIYDDAGAWHGVKGDLRFSQGQKVGPPPFNDRCLAVAGRCGHACIKEQGPMAYCNADGYIEQEYLVNTVPVLFNQTPAVMAFVIVLLCGFAVKTLMLCPGIFTPYPHAHAYEPEMTESLRYIIVISPVAGADENKGTMLRNLIGVVSCMPPDCQCRYHAVINDEGHRDEMKICWQIFCTVLEAIPNFRRGRSYEENVLEFTQMWCMETKILGLDKIGGKVKALDAGILDRLCGRTTLKKLLKESKWGSYDKGYIAPLEAAIEALGQHLSVDYNKFNNSIAYMDVLGDWVPKDPSLMLRLHYCSRAKPVEDDRNIMVQHVAVGSWYYKVPKGASSEEWLQLRKNCKEMVYAIPDSDPDTYNVPLRSSHGKAGGLNFVDNYIALVSRRPENLYNDERDQSPILYAIADARHQFQPDFMISCVPCFFTEGGDLNPKVAFTQAPQHYPEYSDKSDYMDYNNAQFFRLNAMIRNCCGGVSSCGTNGMWLIPYREDDTIWQTRRKRVRDRDSKKRDELIEREQFHTSCKIEDTASSLDQVLVGRHSHFVNRKLSFGMAKAPTDFIGAQQRWVEGAVTLCLQWFSFNADSHGDSAKNAWMLWATVLAFVSFLLALVRLVTNHASDSVLVEYGAISADTFNVYADPVRAQLQYWMTHSDAIFELFGGNTLSVGVFVDLLLQFMVWIMSFVFMFICLWFVTMVCKCFRKCCYFPNEMKWWGRLIISMDNLTYFLWFWTSFFWIGFNYYTALFRMNYHFNNKGMMAFMLVVNILNWSLIIVNTFRYNIMESMDANEIASLNMDNIWRANQLFFMTGPIQLFSLVRGCSEFVKYKFYGQDIGGWSGGDLGRISVTIVKYWTSLMLLGCVGVWLAHAIYAHKYQNSFSACIVVTLISLDVLHPCTFLWLGNATLPADEAAKMTWAKALVNRKWWAVTIKNLILNQTFTGVLKYVGPAYFLVLPLLALSSSYFGVSGAYMLIAMGPGH